MPAKLVYFRPTQIAFIRTDGQCERAISGAWQQVREAMAANSLVEPVDRAFGLHWNGLHGPHREDAYEAGIIHSVAVQGAEGSPFSTRMLPGGSYVRQALETKPELRLREIERLNSHWSENDNFTVDPRRPTIEVMKLRRPSDLDSAKIEICVPVMPRFDGTVAA